MAMASKTEIQKMQDIFLSGSCVWRSVLLGSKRHSSKARGDIMFRIEKLQNLIPLLYLVTIALIAVLFHLCEVPKEMTALIVGAGLTRVKVSAK